MCSPTASLLLSWIPVSYFQLSYRNSRRVGGSRRQEHSVERQTSARPSRYPKICFYLYICFFYTSHHASLRLPAILWVGFHDSFLRSMPDFTGAEDEVELRAEDPLLKSKQTSLPPISLSGSRLRGCALRLKVFSVSHASHLSHCIFLHSHGSHLTVSDASA